MAAQRSSGELQAAWGLAGAAGRRAAAALQTGRAAGEGAGALRQAREAMTASRLAT